MATDVRTPAGLMVNDNDANFRGWGQAIGAALVAVGLVKCSAVEVTGQIDWTTVTRPTTADQARGYEVYKFADALQATSPVFIKISYGSSQYDFRAPALTVTVTNGAIDSGGNPISTPLPAPNTAALEFGMNNWGASAPAGVLWTSGTSSRFAQMWHAGRGDTVGCGVQWGIERTKNNDGTDNGDGVIVQIQANSLYNRVQGWMAGANNANGGGVCQIVLLNNGDNGKQMRHNWSRAPLVFPAGRVIGAGRTGIFGANTAVYPWALPSPRGYENVGMNFISLWSVDATATSQFTAKMYGADHTYRCRHWLDFPGGGWFDDGAATGVLTLQSLMNTAMRWE